jgi:hypothetical protein
MNPRIGVNLQNGGTLFSIEQLTEGDPLGGFSCPIADYNEYLVEDSLRSQADHIALTWLLRERKSGAIMAYMSLIADAIKMLLPERELHGLNYPFRTLPAMKIAKLAVSTTAQEKYKGVGSYMIDLALSLARACNRQFFACCFITVDADIEHDKGLLSFYKKNGFRRDEDADITVKKTISMWKDIFG